MNLLPDEILLCIFRAVPVHSDRPSALFALRAVCRRWRRCVDTPSLWRPGIAVLARLYRHLIWINDLRGPATVIPSAWRAALLPSTLYAQLAWRRAGEKADEEHLTRYVEQWAARGEEWQPLASLRKRFAASFLLAIVSIHV